MSTEIILKLLKSGIWEDALIAFNFMKDWTIEEVKKEFELIDGHKLDLVSSSHIRDYIKLGEKLYVYPGGSWSIRFHEIPNKKMPYITL